MLSKANSILSQKLISWEAVPDATSLDSLVTAWISLIQELTSACSLLRNVGSLRRVWGSMASMETRFPEVWH